MYQPELTPEQKRNAEKDDYGIVEEETSSKKLPQQTESKLDTSDNNKCGVKQNYDVKINGQVNKSIKNISVQPIRGRQRSVNRHNQYFRPLGVDKNNWSILNREEFSNRNMPIFAPRHNYNLRSRNVAERSHF